MLYGAMRIFQIIITKKMALQERKLLSRQYLQILLFGVTLLTGYCQKNNNPLEAHQNTAFARYQMLN